MKHARPLFWFIATFIVLPLAFWAASCESPTVYKDCNVDSLVHHIDSLEAILKDTTTWPLPVTPDTTAGIIQLTSTGELIARRQYGYKWRIVNAPTALNIAMRDQHNRHIRFMEIQQNLLDSIRQYRGIITLKNLTIQRQNDSMYDLAALLEAETKLKEKWKARTDSAVVIIKRQSDQLARCVIDGRIKGAATKGDFGPTIWFVSNPHPIDNFIGNLPPKKP